MNINFFVSENLLINIKYYLFAYTIFHKRVNDFFFPFEQQKAKAQNLSFFTSSSNCRIGFTPALFPSDKKMLKRRIFQSRKWLCRSFSNILHSEPLRVCVVGSGPAGCYTAEKVNSGFVIVKFLKMSNEIV